MHKWQALLRPVGLADWMRLIGATLFGLIALKLVLASALIITDAVLGLVFYMLLYVILPMFLLIGAARYFGCL